MCQSLRKADQFSLMKKYTHHKMSFIVGVSFFTIVILII